MKNKQRLEDDLRQTRELLIFRATELVGLRAEAFAMGSPAPADDAYERAKNAFDIAAYELADHLIREQERGVPEKHWCDGPNLKEFKAKGVDLLGN